MRLWIGAVLGALFIAGCGSADGASPPPRSAPSVHRGSQGEMMHDQIAIAGVQAIPPSPSMAGNYKTAHDEKAAAPPEPDRDSDGIPDVMDKTAPADSPAPVTTPPSQPSKSADASTQVATNHEQSMLVYTANMTLAVYLVDQALNQVEAIARAHGGFLANRGDNQIVIRVPRSQFQSALSDVEKTGDVLHRDVRAEDVTDQFMDLEVRIKNARAIRDQLAALLVKANVKESIEIERELGRVTGELEQMEGQMKLLKDKIAYSTITVNYAARGATIQAMSIRLPFPWLSQLGLPSLLRLEETK